MISRHRLTSARLAQGAMGGCHWRKRMVAAMPLRAAKIAAFVIMTGSAAIGANRALEVE